MCSTSFKRGIRFLNGRKQVLLQDDIEASQPIMWRMHTNATVKVDTSGVEAVDRRQIREYQMAG